MTKTEGDVEDSIKIILSETCESARDYIQSHPEIIYKGVPLLVAFYILYPLIFLTWQWLPWIWSFYELYNRIPSGTMQCLFQISNLYTEKKIL